MNGKIWIMAALVFANTPGFAHEKTEKEYKTHLFSTAHFDTQWNWDVRESIEDYLHRTMVQSFWLFERFPNYVFSFESALKYSWVKEYYPSEFVKVKNMQKTGDGMQWEVHRKQMIQIRLLDKMMTEDWEGGHFKVRIHKTINLREKV